VTLPCTRDSAIPWAVDLSSAVVDNPSGQVVDIVAAGDTVAAHTQVVVDIVVVVPVVHIQAVVDIVVVVAAVHIRVVVDIVVVVAADCMEPAHTGLDMVVVALDIVQMALHLPGS
jgi:hypothetical protein